MKIALVHDFLREYGGAERVLEVLHEIWPKAPVYTAFIESGGLGPHWERLKDWDIRPSWVQKNWVVKKFHSPLRFLAPLVWESFNFDEYDVVISSSGWYICRGILTKPETLHICYLHHPPRHLYGYKTAVEWQKYLLVRIYGHIINHFLRIFDWTASQRVDYFIANSQETARRIEKFYRRNSVVIYPPVSLEETDLSEEKSIKENYFLCVSRLARAKNLHLAIGACNKLNLNLWIVGCGREEKNLQSLAGPTVKFLGQLPDEELPKIYKGACALISPAEDEECGIAVVEAMAYGLPVIALKSGGVIESVIEGKTGEFFTEATIEALINVLKRFNKRRYDPLDCRQRAEEFNKDTFKKKIREFVEEKLQGRKSR